MILNYCSFAHAAPGGPRRRRRANAEEAGLSANVFLIRKNFSLGSISSV